MMLRNQTRNFRNLAARFFRLYCAVTGGLGVLLACPPAGGWRRDTAQRPSAVHPLDRDEEGE
jgi:hypothetical protein